MKKSIFLLPVALLAAACGKTSDKSLEINDLEYFERPGVNVLVYSNLFSGGFNDEKNSGIEIIHHGVRTVQGGAIRLSKTPEQWDLVPATPSRTVNRDNNSIEVALRYEGDRVMLLKRIVAGEGDVVEFRNGTLLVNGEPKLEPYVKFNQGGWNLPPRKVSAGYVYVVGDNRGMPIEQHKFGQIRKSRIQGTLLL